MTTSTAFTDLFALRYPIALIGLGSHGGSAAQTEAALARAVGPTDITNRV